MNSNNNEVTIQNTLNSIRDLDDSHRRIKDILYIIKELYSDEFLDQLFVITLYLMTNSEQEEEILCNINDYRPRSFRIFKDGINQPYTIKDYFGHSVLGWKNHKEDWFILDFLFMPISDVGHGMPLTNYIHLVIHNDNNYPVVIVPVIRNPYKFNKPICLDGLRIRNTVMGVVDSDKNVLYPEIAESYISDILRL